MTKKKPAAKPCSIVGCANAAETGTLCAMHRGRARRGSAAANNPAVLRDGTRGAVLQVHCSPELKSKVAKAASKRGLSASAFCEAALIVATN